MDEILKDERFSHILTDPSFKRIPKKVRKVQIDNRFKNLLKNKRFSEKCSIDEHGCALKLDATENLKKLYNMDEESSESEEDILKDEIDKTKHVSKNKERSKKKKVKDTIKKEESFNDDIRVHAENSLNKVTDKTKMSGKKKDKYSKMNKDLKCETDQFSIFEHKNKLLTNNTPELHKNDSQNKEKLSKLNNIGKQEVKKNKQAKSHEFDSRFKLETESEDESPDEEESDDESESQNESESANSSEEVSDDDTESDDSDAKENDTFDHQWEEQHERAPDTDEITKRLAVCHMDWDRIRAVDLFAVFNSFKPPDSSIISVKIYPSDYGLQRMEEEKLKGPSELVEKTLAVDEEEDVDDKKGSKYHREKLRQYQMNRLKYYYAIVECDTPQTANTLYEQLNGMEYESSSVRFDLRFVPDDVTFDQEPSSVAENPDLAEYKPKLFVTTALQQVKVGLTWDETDPQRREVLQKAFTDPDDIEKDIQEYLASSSEESEEEIINNEEGNKKLSTKDRIQKYKSLLESINEQEKEKSGEKYEMEITWEPGIKEKTESLVKEKLDEKSYTPFEELQKKKKEKQKLKKKAKTLELKESEYERSDMSDSDASDGLKISQKKKISKTNDELYLLSDARKEVAENKKASKKMKKRKTNKIIEDFKVNVNDPRFSAIYTSPLFNIDPSDPHFKNTPGNLAIIAEKQRRLKNKNSSMEETKYKKKFKSS